MSMIIRIRLLQEFFSFLDRFATGRNIFILFILTALFPAVIFPLAGVNAQRIPDARFTYSAAQAIELLQSYTPAERSAYYLGALFIDVLYPLCYAFLLAALLAKLLKRYITPESHLNYILLLPLLAALFDLLENFTLASLLASIGQPSTTLATAASFFTPAKWALVFASMLSVLFLFLTGLFKRSSLENRV